MMNICWIERMIKPKRAVVALGLVLGIFLLGCAGEGEEPVLAEVGDKRIHASELLRFEARLAASLRSKEAGIEGRRQHLQSLIDKQILILEAAARGWDRDPDLRRKLERGWSKRLVQEFFAREVDAKITLEEQKIYDHYLQSGRNRAVRCGRIDVASREEAEEILRLLQGGADFGALARERSIHRLTAAQGGLYSGYVTRDQLPLPIIQLKVYPLEKGQISEAIPLPGGNYGVFQVVDEVAVPLEKVRRLVEAELHREKARVRTIELGRELRDDLDAHPREESFEFFATRLESEGHTFSEGERGTVLYEFDGGTIKVGEFLDSARDNYQAFSGNVREQLQWFAESVLVPRALVMQAARNAGIDRESKMVAWRQAREEEGLLAVIRKKVTADVQVEEAEARHFYDQNPQTFVPQELLTLDEILVATREEAVALRDRIEGGEDLRALAQQYTQRHIAMSDSGRFHLHWYQREAHEALFEAARGATPGDLLGPIEVGVAAPGAVSSSRAVPAGRYYSIFRVIESTLGAGPRSFAEVATRARAIVVQQKRDAAFFQFLGELRQQYESQIEIYEENLRVLVEQQSS